MMDEAAAARDQAQAEAERLTDDAHRRAQGQLAAARSVATDVLTEGEALAANLRDLGRSLEANARLILEDVQASHAALVHALDRVSPGHRPQSQLRGRATERGSGGRAAADEPLGPPEFLRRR